MALVTIIGPVAAAIVAVYVLSCISDSIRHRGKAKALGCGAVVPNNGHTWAAVDPIGVLEAIRGSRAADQMRLLPWIEENLAATEKLHGRRVGTSYMRILCNDVILTSDSENIQAMLAKHFNDFKLGVGRTENFKPLLGQGIFATNGKLWEHSRALLRPQFARAQVSDLDLEARHTDLLLDILSSHRSNQLGGRGGGWTGFVDIQPWLFHLTLDTATEFLFGESVHSQQHNLHPESAEAQAALAFAAAFERAQFLTSTATRLGPYYWIFHTPELKQKCQEVHAFIDRLVARALRPKDDDDNAETSGNQYVFLRALAEETSDPETLRFECLNVLLAGRDTTASLMSWFLFVMASPENKRVFDKLRSAVLEVFGTASQPKDALTFETLKGCQYLQWCLSEILRLYPLVPTNVRTAARDTTLPVGGGPDGKSPVYVREGQDIIYAVFIMQRCTEFWGDDAEEFRPERWETIRPVWDYLPFNGGPRICIGQQFALTEASYVLVRLLQRIDALDGSRLGPVVHDTGLTDCPAGGVNVRLHFAEED